MQNEMPISEGFFARNKISIKIAACFILALILLIPQTFIQSLISDRVSRQNEVIQEIASKWGNEQTIIGPILDIPYKRIYTDDQGKVRTETAYAHLLPETLKIESEIAPEKRSRGIFDTVVYDTTIKMTWNFSMTKLSIPDVKDTDINFANSDVSLGISDLRGIKSIANIIIGDQSLPFTSGLSSNDALDNGLSVAYTPKNPFIDGSTKIPFTVSLELKGSQSISFVPTGNTTEMHMTSPWQNPGFDGIFLPESRTINEKGFVADWKVIDLNRNFPQFFTGGGYKLSESTMSVNLISPVDNYQKVDRSIKYALLIIILTFVALFLTEIIKKLSIHPFQYLLIGVALCIFYTLLLSFSEHFGFDLAYLIAAAMTTLLITLYAKSVLKTWLLASFTCAILVVIYAFIFTILQLEDYALLVGSLGIFAVLAIIMYFSRNIEWYKKSS